MPISSSKDYINNERPTRSQLIGALPTVPCRRQKPLFHWKNSWSLVTCSDGPLYLKVSRLAQHLNTSPSAIRQAASEKKLLSLLSAPKQQQTDQENDVKPHETINTLWFTLFDDFCAEILSPEAEHKTLNAYFSHHGYSSPLFANSSAIGLQKISCDSSLEKITRQTDYDMPLLVKALKKSKPIDKAQEFLQKLFPKPLDHSLATGYLEQASVLLSERLRQNDLSTLQQKPLHYQGLLLSIALLLYKADSEKPSLKNIHIAKALKIDIASYNNQELLLFQALRWNLSLAHE